MWVFPGGSDKCTRSSLHVRLSNGRCGSITVFSLLLSHIDLVLTTAVGNILFIVSSNKTHFP